MKFGTRKYRAPYGLQEVELQQEGWKLDAAGAEFGTRNYRAPYGLQEVELQQEGWKLNAAGVLYVPLTEYRTADPTTSSPLSVGTAVDRRNLPVENRFTAALERDQPESGEGKIMDETLSEAGEEIEVGNTPDRGQRTESLAPAAYVSKN